jgi:hypothetical protein
VKLKGPYNLVEHQGSRNNEWFFMKARHTAASDDFDSKSALTGRSMEEIAGSAAPDDAPAEKSDPAAGTVAPRRRNRIFPASSNPCWPRSPMNLFPAETGSSN